MGMFDEVRCKYPLPIKKAQDFVFQSKDTPAQWLDAYEVREDGTLWHEAYDTRVEYTKDAPLGVFVHRDNRRWERVMFTGRLELHHFDPDDEVCYYFQLWFVDGVVRDSHAGHCPYSQ